ncbi:MAG: DMT family transporter [Bacteroidales bacterium]|nr:DMT family transporter [Bacteroidales bacterium]MCF8405677.1 DMT family transporter [Bacteroidales bacterium]
MKAKQFYVYGSAIISMFFWGMSFVWTSVLLKYYEPITIIFFRLLLSTIVLFLWLKLFGGITKIKKEDYKLFLVSSLFNPFLYFIGENYGVKLTTPTISAVVIATIPLFAPIAAYLSFREKLSWLNIAGLLVSFFGISIMLFNRNFSLDADIVGIGALFFAVFSAVGYSVLLKKLSFGYNPFFIIAIQNLIGLIYFAPLFFFLEAGSVFSKLPNSEAITSVIALAVFCSSLAYVGFAYATREIGIARTNVFTNLIPVFTAIFSFLLIGEQINSQKILGILIVIAGLLFAQIRKLNKSIK